MARINLLPWREWRRKEQQREFGVAAAGSVVVMLGIIFIVHVNVSGMIEKQQSRNDFLQEHIQEMNARIQEIRELEKEKEQLLARMRVIERLQRNRPEIVHLFDELAKQVPEGLYLEHVLQKGTSLTLDGEAQSNARVSALMRNLDRSEWFADPVLQVIRAGSSRSNAGATRSFTLHVKQVSPTSEQEEEQ